MTLFLTLFSRGDEFDRKIGRWARKTLIEQVKRGSWTKLLHRLGAAPLLTQLWIVYLICEGRWPSSREIHTLLSLILPNLIRAYDSGFAEFGTSRKACMLAYLNLRSHCNLESLLRWTGTWLVAGDVNQDSDAFWHHIRDSTSGSWGPFSPLAQVVLPGELVSNIPGIDTLENVPTVVSSLLEKAVSSLRDLPMIPPPGILDTERHALCMISTLSLHLFQSKRTDEAAAAFHTVMQICSVNSRIMAYARPRAQMLREYAGCLLKMSQHEEAVAVIMQAEYLLQIHLKSNTTGPLDYLRSVSDFLKESISPFATARDIDVVQVAVRFRIERMYNYAKEFLTREGESLNDWTIPSFLMSYSFAAAGLQNDALQAVQVAMDSYLKHIKLLRGSFGRPTYTRRITSYPQAFFSYERWEPKLRNDPESGIGHTALKEAVEIHHELFKGNTYFDLWLSLLLLSYCLLSIERNRTAVDAICDAVRVCLYFSETRRVEFRVDLAWSLHFLSYSLATFGRFEEAITASDQAVEVLQSLGPWKPRLYSKWMETFVWRQKRCTFIWSLVQGMRTANSVPLASHSMASTFAPVPQLPEVRCQAPCSATLPGELSVSAGEQLRVLEVVGNGNCLCVNASGTQGTISMQCFEALHQFRQDGQSGICGQIS
jgi:tetratricopeptide (TPR) repeat protein